MKKDIIHLGTAVSTNDVLKERPTPKEGEMLVASADYQTRGRGQACNSWESERGKNLLMSILIGHVGIEARKQFLLSMVGALALKATLDTYTSGISLKWPNDIYWRNRKISGTLIETSLAGKHIVRCIYGIGLNVNQRAFRSDAPNPVSLWQIIGMEVAIDEIMGRILERFDHYYSMLDDGCQNDIVDEYNRALFWRDGAHPFEEVATGTRLMARIKGVGIDGLLRLITDDGSERAFALKEIRFLVANE